jgi:hypothetical protein
LKGDQRVFILSSFIIFHINRLVLIRLGSLVCRRFVTLELGFQQGDTTGIGFEDLELAKEQHSMYIPCVILILSSIADFTVQQFDVNKEWAVPLLSQLLMCENRQIRLHVSKVYSSHVNPIVLNWTTS